MTASTPAVPPSLSQQQSADRLSPIVAVVIAFATLIAATAGFLQADTSNQASNRRDQAEQLSLQALASSQSGQQNAQVQVETFERYLQQRTEAGNATLAGLYAGSDTVRASALQREADRWNTVAAATLKLTNIDPQGEFGPEKDPTFPQRYFAEATQESLRLNALADAADEKASATDQQAAAYTAILATLAVSLYLFGLTLAVGGRWLRYGFLGVGLLLLGIGTLVMAQTLLAPAYRTNDQAAAEYAQARVAALTAYDASGFHDAEAHYARAIALRPTFARAYVERAGVIFQGASPQRSGYVSIAPPEALQRARADLQTARALGLENAQTFGELGFYGFAEGVQSGDINLLNQSVDYTRRAIALDPGEPIYRYNLGVALAAADRIDDARNAYNDAVARTLYVDDALTVPRQEPGFEEAVLGGALTDLEIVRRYRTDLEVQIVSLKEQIVGRVAAERRDAPQQSPATFADLQLDVFPAQVQWQGDIANYDPSRDTISAQWYHQDPQGLGWAVVPQISTADYPTQGTDGRYFRLSAYLSRITPPQCLPSGQYKVEIYINGRLSAEGTVATDFSDYQAFFARDLTSAFCLPPDWVRRTDGIPGLMDGYTSPDHQYGAYIARYGIPGSLHGLDDPSAEIENLTITAFASWFPQTPTYVDSSGTTDEYFEGLTGTAWRLYDYGTGFVRVGAGLTSDGAVSIGMVYGPYDWFKGGDPYRILSSMIHVD